MARRQKKTFGKFEHFTVRQKYITHMPYGKYGFVDRSPEFKRKADILIIQENLKNLRLNLGNYSI